MKINADRLYTYPVLAAGRDDYKTCNFSAKMNCSFDAANNFVFEINCRTDCAEIKNLIADGDAEYLLHVECPTTFYRKVFTDSVENFSCKIPFGRVKKNIEFLAFIVLCRDVEKFSCRDWNEDFEQLSFDLQKGSVLAYQNLQSLKIPDDPNILKSVGSIFSIHKKPEDDTSPFDMEMTSEKIKIGLNAKDYILYRRYCSKPEMQPILNAMIILPALVSVFEELKLEDAPDHNSDTWFLSLQAAYKRKGLNFNDLLVKEDSLKLAQEVMGLPIRKALENIALICEDAAEDSE